MTAKQITAEIQRLSWPSKDSWERSIGKQTVLHVRCEPQRYLGVFYRVWASRGTRILGTLFAMNPKTAGQKARSLVTQYGEP
jgi:hypothetical protein